MADYSYRVQFTPYSKGYPGESTGAIPEDPSWHDGTADGGSAEADYYWSDSNLGNDANSSRVTATVRDLWTAEKLKNNVIRIHLKTSIINVCRRHQAGNPDAGLGWVRTVSISSTLQDSLNRNYIKKYDPWRVDDYTCKGGVANIADRYIDLQPGDSTNIIASLFIHSWSGPANNPDGHYKAPNIQDDYNDSMGVGVAFRNNLPKEISHRLVYHYNNGQPNKIVDWTDPNECTTTTLDSWAPTRTHWIFKGWSTSPSATTATHQPGSSIGVCEETHVYAVWKYTYRPGMHRVGGIWYSCDRDGVSGPLGRAQVLFNNKWIEMRIRDDTDVGLSDPPCIKKGAWGKMHLIGKDGTPHDISWSCPHQWNRYY